jgi:hypothetical protein
MNYLTGYDYLFGMPCLTGYDYYLFAMPYPTGYDYLLVIDTSRGRPVSSWVP